jgi:signal transduction histidine kinase
LNEERAQTGGVIFVWSHVVLLTIFFVQFWSPTTIIPYLFAVLAIVANVTIHINAGFSVWAVSTAFMFGVLLFLDQFTIGNISLLLQTAGINLLIILIYAIAANDWSIALVSLEDAHEKARKRRDDLFSAQSQLQKTNARLQVLNNQLEATIIINNQLASILDLDQLLTEVIGVLKGQFNYNYIGLFWLNEANSALTLRTHDSPNPPGPNVPTLSLALSNIITTAANEQQICLTNDLLSNDYPFHYYLLPDSHSEIAIPLIAGGQLFGVLDIQSPLTHAFEGNDVSILGGLANQLAIAIQNAILYKNEEKNRKFAERLNTIGRALSGTLNWEEELNLILQYLAEIVPHERAGVLLHRENKLDMVAARGFPPDFDLSNIQIDVDETDEKELYTQILHTKEPLNVPDVVQLPSWKRVGRMPTPRAWLGIPLVRDNEVIGLFSIARAMANPFTEEEVTLATTFAGQAAIALQNARLFMRIERFNLELEEKVAQRTEDLQMAYLKLERLDQAKTDFIGVISHELRTPLTVLRGYSDMLLQEQTIAENAYHHQLATGIRSGSKRLHEVVNTMLDMIKIDSQSLTLHPEKLLLRQLWQKLTREFTAVLQERQLQLTLDGMEKLPAISADPAAIKKVFTHLTANAIKYTPDGGQITITGHSFQKENGQEYVEIIIADSGIGIDPEYQDLIFTKFYQTGKAALHSSGQTKFKGGGSGLGLAIVKGIIVAHQGEVWVESEGHDEETYPGSRFHVVLPHQMKTESK